MKTPREILNERLEQIASKHGVSPDVIRVSRPCPAAALLARDEAMRFLWEHYGRNTSSTARFLGLSREACLMGITRELERCGEHHSIVDAGRHRMRKQDAMKAKLRAQTASRQMA